MSKKRKQNWVPIYRDKGKTVEAWASTNGSDVISERSHKEGPDNVSFQRSKCGVVAERSRPGIITEAYRRGYANIIWDGSLKGEQHLKDEQTA